MLSIYFVVLYAQKHGKTSERQLQCTSLNFGIAMAEVDIQRNVLLRGIFAFGFTSFNSHDVFIRFSVFVCLFLILDFERVRIAQT